MKFLEYPELKGQTVIVTGAGSGIGRATARAFDENGCELVLVGRSREKLEACAGELNGTPLVISGDLGDSGFVKKAITEISQKRKTLDVLVNNAGIEGFVGPLEEQTEAQFDEIINVNVKSVWALSRGLVGLLRASKGAASIVNVSSVAGLKSFAMSSLYCMSKHALVGLSKAMTLEWGPDVRVNLVCPGPVGTPMLDRIFPSGAEALGAELASRRIGAPEEIAESVLWIVSNRSKFMRGSPLILDGGEMLQ